MTRSKTTRKGVQMPRLWAAGLGTAKNSPTHTDPPGGNTETGTESDAGV